MAKAVFLDRDGVISKSDVRAGKPYAPKRFTDFKLLPDVIASIRSLKYAGFLIVVVTNQPDVGNGLTPREEVERMNDTLLNTLHVDAVKACYHRQDEGCACRKPEPGMLIEAADDLRIDLSDSFMVGDRWSDIAAGRSAGCRTVFIDRGYSERRPDAPDFTAISLSHAAELILGATPD
ncbi:MAG TPA: HAD family hydrolase [Rhodospirillaceae bacterium]|nr:HAD family hydrolase [Rhodospirillaceae bacterium]